MKVDHLSQVRAFDQKLLFGNEASDQVGFRLIQVESLAVCRAVHSRIGEKYLGLAGLNDHRQGSDRYMPLVGLMQEDSFSKQCS